MKKTKKLVLSRETLRELETIALNGVAGGATGVCYYTYTCGDDNNPCDRYTTG